MPGLSYTKSRSKFLKELEMIENPHNNSPGLSSTNSPKLIDIEFTVYRTEENIKSSHLRRWKQTVLLVKLLNN